jgi:Zn-dependent M28 family amino/carboxypeptidase
MDMIGRDATEHAEKGISDGVYVIGASLISSTLDSLLTVSNVKTHNLTLDMGLNNVRDPQQIYRRSDHWNFGRLGIPFVFYFTGIHEDYHRPSDEVDKINFDKYTKITQLIYQNTLEIANSDKRPIVDNQEFIEATRQAPRN